MCLASLARATLPQMPTPEAPRWFALFDTVIGRAGIAWSALGVTRIALPEASEAATHQRLAAHAPGGAAAPPPDIARAIALIVQHVAGQPAPLEDIALDMTGVPPFHQRVYEVARAIPCGRTMSYGALAVQVDVPGGARAIGRAMGANPFPIVVPCHRVLAANHGSGGFSAHGGVQTKAKLLAAEGVTFAIQPSLPFGS